MPRVTGHWRRPQHTPAGAGPCAHFADRELHHPPPAVQKARRDSGLCPGGDGPCPPSLREGPSESAAPPVCNGWRRGGGECRVSGPLIAQNPRATSPRLPPADLGTWVHCHPHPRFFLGRLCLPEPPANAQPGPPQKRVQPGLGLPPTPTSPSPVAGLTAAHQALAQGADGSHGRCPRRPHRTCKGRRAARVPRPQCGVTALCLPVTPGSVGAWAPDRGSVLGGCGDRSRDTEVLEGQTGRCPFSRGWAGGSPAQEAGPGELLWGRGVGRETEGAELLAIASRGRPTSSSEADRPRGHRAQRQESPEVPAPADPVSTPLPAPGTTCTLPAPHPPPASDPAPATPC